MVQTGDVIDVADNFKHKDSDKCEPNKQFDQEVLNRKMRLAGTAAAPQDQVTQHGDVVEEKSDRLEALAATGSGPQHTFLVRQTGDYHVEQAAEHRAQDKGDNSEVDQWAVVEKKVQHAARISATICSGERSPVSMMKSATNR